MGWTLKNSLPGFMRQEARLVAVSLATETQPFGTSSNSRAVGIAATGRDIYRVYTTPGKAFKDITDPRQADSFWKAIKSNRWDRAQRILSKYGNALKSTPIQSFDGGAQHKQLRNNQGRIPPSQKPVMIVQDPTRLKTYVASEQKKVGFGKGGWSTCASKLGGTRGIPGWVSRQNAPGDVIEDYGKDISKVTLINQVPYASDILSPENKEDAISIARDKLAKSILTALRFSPT